MSIAYDDVEYAVGQNNDAGTQTEIFWAPLADVLTFPKVPADPADFTTAVTITGDFVMKPGKKFNTLYCTLEEGEVTSSLVGERDGKSMENMINGFYPGNKAQILGFIEWAKNTPLVMVVKELEGQMRIMGSDGLPCYIETADLTTGKKVADRKGITWSAKSVGRIAPILTGAVPLTLAI